jgi:dienelactone hydrolase
MTFAVDYRVGMGAMVAVQDVAAAIGYLLGRSHLVSGGGTVSVESGKIGILGSSAGAIIASILARTDPRIRAAVSWSGHAGNPPLDGAYWAPLYDAHSTIDGSSPFKYAQDLQADYEAAGEPHDQYVTDETVHGLQFWNYDDPSNFGELTVRAESAAWLDRYVKGI